MHRRHRRWAAAGIVVTLMVTGAAGVSATDDPIVEDDPVAEQPASGGETSADDGHDDDGEDEDDGTDDGDGNGNGNDTDDDDDTDGDDDGASPEVSAPEPPTVMTAPAPLTAPVAPATATPATAPAASAPPAPAVPATIPRVVDRTYTVVRGDGFHRIASKTGVPVNTILSLNGLRLTSTIHPGQVLKIGTQTVQVPNPAHLGGTAPTTSGTPAAPATPTAPQIPVYRTYKIVKGDSLYRIASRNGITLNQLLALNAGLRITSVIHPGQVLNVAQLGTTAAPTTPAAPATPTTPTVPAAPAVAQTYTVVRGDGFHRIASKTGVPVNTILSLNGLRLTSTIHPGQVLKISAGSLPGAITLPSNLVPTCERVQVLGDSLTVGTTQSMYDRFGSYGQDVLVDGRNSRTIATGANNGLDRVAANRSAHGDSDCWVVALGTNDLANSAASNQQSIDRLVDAISANGAQHHIYWVNTYLIRSAADLQRATAFNALLARDARLRVIDFATAASNNRTWFAGDGVHLNANGYRARTDIIVSALASQRPV